MASAASGRPCRILLVGMMGSGKSTIGRLLSHATGWPYVDNDELLRRRTGTTARELLASGGEARLRTAESEAFALGLALPPPVIVGVAAGTILDAANRERMAAGGVVVWLRASSSVLVARAAEAAHRPFVDRDPADWLADAAHDRAPLYLGVADVTVDTGTGTPQDGVQQILTHLNGAAVCPEVGRG